MPLEKAKDLTNLNNAMVKSLEKMSADCLTMQYKRRMTVKKVVFTFLALIACSLSLAQKVGDIAPDFQLSNANGETVTRPSLEGGPVVITFWATWCGICISELPQLRQLADSGVPVYLISETDRSEDVLTFLNDYKLTSFQPLLSLQDGDSTKAVASRWQVYGQPVTFVLDTKGNIAANFMGYVSLEDLQAALSKVD
jgi:cytochrome c biogenesis protein CcmG, thiol:disulfide interchange protein DsbE